LQESFIAWVNAACQLSEGDVVAIDGKTVRRSFQKGDRKSAIHMVGAWASQNGLVLGQQKVDSKSNEITATPALLELMELKGSIVTIDAMGTRREIVKAIVAKGADYVLALKGNQGTLKQEVKLLFSKPIPAHLEAQAREEEVESGHGRIENRLYRQVSLRREGPPSSEGWAGLKSVIEVTSMRDDRLNRSTEKRTSSAHVLWMWKRRLGRYAATGALRTVCTGCWTSHSGRMSHAFAGATAQR